VHASAVVDPTATVAASSHVGANAVIGAGSRIGANAFIGPGCVIGKDAAIGDGGRLQALIYVGDGVRIGQRARIGAGAVIGSRGFGLARGPAGWEEIPQTGTVVVGDDVEIGANTTIDRGALDDTVIANGVKLDNLIQVAHNVRIGEHTIMAAQSGVAGSARIGARCMIGGASAINGHIEIGDDVLIIGFSMVTKSLPARRQYGSGMPIRLAKEWRRDVARVHRLGTLDERVAELEKLAGIVRKAGQGEDDGGEQGS